MQKNIAGVGVDGDLLSCCNSKLDLLVIIPVFYRLRLSIFSSADFIAVKIMLRLQIPDIPGRLVVGDRQCLRGCQRFPSGYFLPYFASEDNIAGGFVEKYFCSGIQLLYFSRGELGLIIGCRVRQLHDSDSAQRFLLEISIRIRICKVKGSSSSAAVSIYIIIGHPQSVDAVIHDPCLIIRIAYTFIISYFTISHRPGDK